MVRSITKKVRDTLTDVAQRSAKGVKSLAGDALDAAATAAADVVLGATANALEAGRTKIEQSAPAMKKAIGKAAKRTVSKPVRGKAVTKRTTTSRTRKRKRRSR